MMMMRDGVATWRNFFKPLVVTGMVRVWCWWCHFFGYTVAENGGFFQQRVDDASGLMNVDRE